MKPMLEVIYNKDDLNHLPIGSVIDLRWNVYDQIPCLIILSKDGWIPEWNFAISVNPFDNVYKMIYLISRGGESA